MPIFKDKVIRVVQQIPKGCVTTYGTVATLAGLPRGGRLVGGILHFTSDELDLPWQRIINRFGYISTKCLEHPKALQKALLEMEGVEVSDDFVVDLNKYGWWGDEKDVDYC
ncbi:MAG: MGMT family protein [bacterium]|nr:MGMT family protein [bacterium]